MNLSATIAISVLGGLAVARGGAPVPLPASRKTRALLGLLTLSGSRPHRRERLCEMFWELPDDPRGALRWSLSKIRAVLDGPSAGLLVADREHVRLDTGQIDIDLQTARRLADAGGPPGAIAAALQRLREPLLDGLDLSNSPSFQSWLTAEREDAVRLRCSLLRLHVTRSGLAADARLAWCREWHECDPFNAEAARNLEQALRELGRRDEAEAMASEFRAALKAAGLEPPVEPEPDMLAVNLETLAERDLLQRQKIRFCTAADGVRIAYAMVGDGPPLVKAANWLNHLELDWDAPIWAPLFRQLARDHCFIRYDERGNGLSQADAGDISFDAFVRDLETVVDTAGIERFPLLGISQGCAVAIEYAARHPERVSHLVLWGGYASGWRLNADDGLRAEREAIITLVRSGWARDDAIYRQIFSSTFLPGATPEELEWFNAFQRQVVSAANAARFLEVFADIDVRHRLRQIAAPTLVMHARGDRRIPLAIGGQLAAEIPHAEFVTLDSDNHLLLGREPASKLFVAHTRQFLADGQPAA